MPIRMLKKEEDKKENKKKKPKGSSKLDIFKSYGKYDGKPVELKDGGLTGNQHKLDKNKDGKRDKSDKRKKKPQVHLFLHTPASLDTLT